MLSAIIQSICSSKPFNVFLLNVEWNPNSHSDVLWSARHLSPASPGPLTLSLSSASHNISPLPLRVISTLFILSWILTYCCVFFLQGSPHCSKPSLKSYFQKDLPGPHFKVVFPLPPPPSHHHWCCHSLLIPPSQNLSHSDFLLASPAVPGTLSFLLSILSNLIMIPCTLEMCHLSAKCKKWINVRNRN